MNRKKLSGLTAKRIGGLSRKHVDRILVNAIKIIIETLKTGEEVNLTGLGTFSARFRPGRVGVNPRKTEERVQVGAMHVPKFKPGHRLKKTLKAGITPPPPPAPPQPENSGTSSAPIEQK